MKVTEDFDGYLISNVGMRKGAMTSNDEYRRDTRDRKVEFPNKRTIEIERRPKRKACKNKKRKVEEFDPKNNGQPVLTQEERERLLALDNKNKDFDLVLDCQLYFPEDDEQE